MERGLVYISHHCVLNKMIRLGQLSRLIKFIVLSDIQFIQVFQQLYSTSSFASFFKHWKEDSSHFL
jgi:hypothetical protein